MSDVEVGWTLIGVLVVIFVAALYFDRKRMF